MQQTRTKNHKENIAKWSFFRKPNGVFPKLRFDFKTQDSVTQELGHICLALLALLVDAH